MEWGSNAEKRKKQIKKKYDDLGFEVVDYDQEKSILILDLINRSSTPLQGISLELYDDLDTPLKIKKVTGGFHSAKTKIGFLIPFIKASMDSDDHTESFTLQLENTNLSKSIIINFSYEDPISQDTKSGSDEITIEI